MPEPEPLTAELTLTGRIGFAVLADAKRPRMQLRAGSFQLNV